MDSLNIKVIDHRHKHVPMWLVILQWLILVAILFGPGVLVDSTAMQWAGFIVFLAGAFLCLLGSTNEKLTIEQARTRLDELEAKQTSKTPSSNRI
ncbi:hypothetical protein EBB79_08210 [Parasedimentitalea marina]|uniref:Uncharacterized protein n=1 Tax=Parasedimentitalea marina TaxID=2483033 RepID=A0A3T0N1L0_9RHOB|nr:hypothetical protein [Parasedimentitalea marina]AZV77879.1 hypothetical protein EBB79_08210 [Parasedimentitalea marina]